jgi:hypothetical protein
MNVVESAEVETHCENVVALLQVNVPGVHDWGSAVEDGVDVDVDVTMEGEVAVDAAVRVGDVFAAVVSTDVSVVAVMSDVAADVNVAAVVVVRRSSSKNVLVRLPVSVSRVPLVSRDPVVDGAAVEAVELPNGKGGTDVAVDAVVTMAEAVPVVVVAGEPLISKPGPGSGVMASWP